MGQMKRRDVIQWPDGRGVVFMEALLNAREAGYPIANVFAEAGIEFEELFRYPENLFLCYDTTRDGISQVTLHNKRSSFAFVRPTGIVMITYRNNNAIQRYEGNGIMHVVTVLGSKRSNRRLYLNPTSLQPYYMNGGDCR